VRISEPTFNPQKTREIILYLLEKCPKITQEKLYVMLYFIDMDFYEKHEEHLMGFSWKKKKMNELIELKQRQRLEELRNLTTFQIDIQRVCNKFFQKLRDYNGKQSLQNT